MGRGRGVKKELFRCSSRRIQRICYRNTEIIIGSLLFVDIGPGDCRREC